MTKLERITEIVRSYGCEYASETNHPTDDYCLPKIKRVMGGCQRHDLGGEILAIIAEEEK